MSRTARMLRSVVGLSLAVILGLGLAIRTAKAEPSANDAEKAKLSPGAEAREDGRQESQVPVHLFLAGRYAAKPRDARRVSGGVGRSGRQGQSVRDSSGRRDGEEARGASRREPLANAARLGHRPQRGRYEGLRHSVRGEAASRGVCKPLHGGLHEGPPGSETRAAVRRACLAASQASVAPAGRAGLHGGQGIREKQPGGVPGRR